MSGTRYSIYLSLIMFTTICLLLADVAFAKELITTGQGRTRHIALSDALRNAISQGTGVQIKSLTSIRNFELEFDKIISGTSGGWPSQD